MSEQQCFQDVAGKIIDVDAKRSQLLSWIDSLANAFGKSFAFDKYYLFLASLLVDPQQVAYANYNEKDGIINLLAFFEDSLIEFYLKDSAFESPPFIEKGLSPFFVDALRQKVQAAVETYKARRKIYQDLFYIPSIEKRVPVPVELEEKLRDFTGSWGTSGFPQGCSSTSKATIMNCLKYTLHFLISMESESIYTSMR